MRQNWHRAGWHTRRQTDTQARQDATTSIIMEGGLTWLAWLGFGESVRTLQRGPMVTINGLEPAEHAAPAYNMSALDLGG